ncbi:MAG: Ppx/GppA phosphatase family protein [Pseudomonadota bacterium]
MTNPPRAAGDPAKSAAKTGSYRQQRARRGPPPRYAALDLGTNNCRLLIAAPRGRHLRIVDAYSKIVRLGEGLSQSGVLSDAAMARTIEVLKTCQRKIKQRGVTHLRCVATQACRGARNGEAFLARVVDETGMTLEIIGPEEEARLAMLGCRDLFDAAAKMVLVFDIGGGSTDIAWVRITASAEEGALPQSEIVTWTSLPFGVVSLAEKWDGRDITRETYEAIVAEVRDAIANIPDTNDLQLIFQSGHAHFLGTSGTVTSLAGVHLALARYRRVDVDGLWLTRNLVRQTSEKLRAMSFNERAQEPCIGAERADLVVCGCAILEAILAEWPADRIRVADRGLREGILSELSGGRRMISPGAQKRRGGGSVGA